MVRKFDNIRKYVCHWDFNTYLQHFWVLYIQLDYISQGQDFSENRQIIILQLYRPVLFLKWRMIYLPNISNSLKTEYVTKSLNKCI